MKNRLVKQIIGTAGVQVLGKGLAMLVLVLLARMLGPEKFGEYSFILSVITLLTLPIVAGMPALLTREMAKLRKNNNRKLINGLIIWTTLYVFVASVAILLIFKVVNEWFLIISTGSLLSLSLFLVPLKGWLTQFSAVINGFDKPQQSQVVLLAIVPLIVSLMIIICHALNYEIFIETAILINIGAYFIAVFVCIFYMIKNLGLSPFSTKTIFDSKYWFNSLLPLSIAIIVGTMTNELAIVTLGIMSEADSVGYFRIAIQLIAIMTFGLNASNTVMRPKIASSYSRDDYNEMQDSLRTSVRLSITASLPFVVVILFFRDAFVDVLFGEGYEIVSDLLVILCISQVINVCMGSVGLVLNMTGYERVTLKVQIVTLVLTIVLLFLLIPKFGVYGAAISVSISNFVWNIIMAKCVHDLTGLKPWIH